ncbi:MAG: molybdate ABC transporter permease subunit [Rhodothermaceae bacterium]|nr:molybdate ABC transporter permease subunit [Rhodothermaceae bacterium]MXX58536.1 molybdate ABC transporter permease subunit [Rhodothermaceae bacterium]MXZ04565.1 molybdate ABC transporter permease subunit [Rhodothermaceae bacterium]MYD19888.1 molybdate ABC transporter permease subunit [Rhodothermaceae bacterium]MYD55638.1 molybdate ABC transporter permease subunit [Rhodothermaceae bacterium]
MSILPQEWAIIALSARVAAAAVALMLIPGILTAWYLARRKSPITFAVENLVQLPLVLPPVVTGLLLLTFLGPNGAGGRILDKFLGIDLAFTAWGAALAAGIMAFPLLVQTFRVAIEQIDPEWEEAVSVYGGGRWAAFRWVTLPLAARGVIAGIVLGFARAVGEFGATIVFAGNIPGRTQTIPLAVFTRLGQVGGEAQLIRLVLVAVGLSVLSLSIHAYLSTRLIRVQT